MTWEVWKGLAPSSTRKMSPVFHEPWEGRVIAMTRAVQASGKFKLSLRPPIETIPAVDYLRMSYWERWLKPLVEPPFACRGHSGAVRGMRHRQRAARRRRAISRVLCDA